MLLTGANGQNKAKPVWTKEELSIANTADSSLYLGKVEREVIQLLNLARLYPQKFKEVELKGYFGTKKYGDYLKNSPWITSLEIMLDTLAAMQPLIPDSSISEYAKCFTIEMGEAGTTSYERINCAYNPKYGECSSFGMETAKDIVLQMLIDHNIEKIGHRLRCLDPKNQFIGLHLHTHKEWEFCCVMDFFY